MTYAMREADLARAQSVDVFLSLVQTLMALSSEEEYADNFGRLHSIAERGGLTFIGRS